MAVSPNANGTTVQLPYPPLGAAELSVADAERMAAMFKALADPVRLRLFSRLAALTDEACVCEIQDVGVSQPTVSHHLKKLREAGLIVSERRGTWVYCRVAPGILPAMARMLAPGADKVPRPHKSPENMSITEPSAGPPQLPLAATLGGPYAPDHVICATRAAAATCVTNTIASRGRRDPDPDGRVRGLNGDQRGRDRGEHLVVRSTPIADPGDLLGWLPEPAALAWVHRGAGLAGWGEAAKVTLPAGDDRFTAGEKWLREVFDGADVTDEVGTLGTGPVAFGSFTFDASSDGSVLVVPRAVLGRDGRGRAWRTTIAPASEGTDAAAARPPAISPLRAPGGIRWHDGSLTAPQWERAVAAAVRRITQGQLRKVVLARDLYATASRPVDERVLLRRLAARYPDCFTFACAGLVGATPELLIRRAGAQISALVLAGTAPRGSRAEEDAALAAGLLGSAKNIEEHAYAAASVREALEPLCAALDVSPRPELLRLANVQHLGTRVLGTLATDRSALALAGALHPTAAVGGTPTETAVELIRELEQMDRERYAGPVGWMDASGNGEWGIALRCAQVRGRGARLFAGCGIVAGSDPAAELAEAQVKFRPMQSALEQLAAGYVPVARAGWRAARRVKSGMPGIIGRWARRNR